MPTDSITEKFGKELAQLLAQKIKTIYPDFQSNAFIDKVFPKNLRIILVTQLILQLFFLIIMLQMGGFISLWFSAKLTKIIGIVMSAYLSLNIIMNLMSKSKKEKYVMTPISLIAAICFWIASLQM